MSRSPTGPDTRIQTQNSPSKSSPTKVSASSPCSVCHEVHRSSPYKPRPAAFDFSATTQTDHVEVKKGDPICGRCRIAHVVRPSLQKRNEEVLVSSSGDLTAAASSPKRRRGPNNISIPSDPNASDNRAKRQTTKNKQDWVNELTTSCGRSEAFGVAMFKLLDRILFKYWGELRSILVTCCTASCKCGRQYNLSEESMQAYDEGPYKAVFCCPRSSCLITIPIPSQWVCKEIKKDQRNFSNYSKVVLGVLRGQTFENFQSSRMKTIDRKTWRRWTSGIYTEIVTMFRQHITELREDTLARIIRKERGPLRLAMDSGWAHRGHHSPQCTFIVRDIDENKVFYAMVVDQHTSKTQEEDRANYIISNFPHVSKMMECEAVKQFAEDMQSEGIWPHVQLIVTDGDQSNPKIMERYAGHVTYARDPGHAKKNFQASLIKVFGSAETTKAYPRRIAKFFVRIIVYLSRTFPGTERVDYEKRCQVWEALWDSAFDHFTRRTCPQSCVCKILHGMSPEDFAEACEQSMAQSATNSISMGTCRSADTIDLRDIDESLLPRSHILRNHIWLDSSSPKHAQCIELMRPIWNSMKQSAKICLHNANTCMVEASHARRASLASKKSNYTKSYASRAFLSCLLENLPYETIGNRLVKLRKPPKLEIFPAFTAVLREWGRRRELDRRRRQDKENKAKAMKQRTQRFVSQQLRKQAFQGVTDPAYRQKLLDETLSPIAHSSKKSRTKAQRQADLKVQYHANPTTHCGIKFCRDCGMYWKLSHTGCKKGSVPMEPTPPEPSTKPPEDPKPTKKRKRNRSVDVYELSSDHSRGTDDDPELQLAMFLSLQEAQNKSDDRSANKLLAELYAAIASEESAKRCIFKFMPVRKDGNCLFSALRQSLQEVRAEVEITKVIPDSDSAMRALLVGRLRGEERAKFKIGQTSGTLREHIDMNGGFDEHVAQMAKDGTHGQEFELLVCAKWFEVNIEVFCHGPRPMIYHAFPTRIMASKRRPTIRLVLTFRPEHYEWLSADPVPNDNQASM